MRSLKKKADGETIKNGAFTYSILECLKQNQGKELKVNTLKQYAEKRVEGDHQL